MCVCLCLLVWTQWQRHWSFYCLKCQLTGKWIQIWNVINMKFCSFSLFNTDYMLLESMQFLDWPQRGKCACYKLYYIFNSFSSCSWKLKLYMESITEWREIQIVFTSLCCMHLLMLNSVWAVMIYFSIFILFVFRKWVAL